MGTYIWAMWLEYTLDLHGVCARKAGPVEMNENECMSGINCSAVMRMCSILLEQEGALSFYPFVCAFTVDQFC